MDSTMRRMMGLPYENLYSYWQHYWRCCVEKLIDKDNVSFRIVGPQLIIRDLIEELMDHGLSNQENISLFRNEISRLDKNDEVFKQLCHPVVACLLKNLDKTEGKDSCIILANQILSTLVAGRYFSLLVDWLATTIDKTYRSDYESRHKINDITHLVLAEYVARGFVYNEIKSYASEIPGVFIAEGGAVIAAPSEFDGLNETDFASEEEYNAAVYERIKNWSVYKKLEILKEYYYVTPKDAYFVVRLEGIKGQINDYIGDVNIYSPKVKRYIKDKGVHSFSYVEDVSEDRDRVNAAIPIGYISIEKAIVDAKAKLEEVLDIIMLTYRTSSPVTMSADKYSVVIDGDEVSWIAADKDKDPQRALREEMLQYIEALDLTDASGDGFKFLSEKHHILGVGHGALQIRLKNAAHWYAKAVASDKDEDVLLYSWFAVEGLLKVDSKTQSEMLDGRKKYNSFLVIQKFVTAILCQNYFHSHLRSTYSNFLYLTNQYNNYYDIDEAVINKAALNLKEGDHYRDGDFLKAMPDMIACINDDVVRDELAQLQKFYQDKNGIKDKENQLKNDLLMIYRLRNMIVHNAALSSVNLAFYAREAMYVARHVVWYVIDRASGDKTIEEIILGAKLSYEVFIANYDKELEKLKS